MYIQDPEFNRHELQHDNLTIPVIRSLSAEALKRIKKVDNHVLMCGDGGNDVGALKQGLYIHTYTIYLYHIYARIYHVLLLIYNNNIHTHLI